MDKLRKRFYYAYNHSKDFISFIDAWIFSRELILQGGNMAKKCNQCDFGTINFWNYRECFKFITNIDTENTFFTSYREKDAIRLNPNGECVWFKRTPWYKRFYHYLKRKW